MLRLSGNNLDFVNRSSALQLELGHRVLLIPINTQVSVTYYTEFCLEDIANILSLNNLILVLTRFLIC